MKPFRDQSIRKKLRVIAMSSVMIAVLLTGLASLLIIHQMHQRIAINNISSLGQVIAENCVIPLSFKLTDDASDVLASLKTRKTIISAILYDETGSVFAKFQGQAESTNTPNLLDKLIDAPLYDDFITITVPVIFKDEQIGSLRIDDNLSEMDQSILHVSLAILVVMILALSIAYLIAAKLQNLIVKPITELARIAHLISKEKGYKVRAKKYANDELGKLTDAFNTMLSQIHKRDTSLRESEASHRIIADHAPEAIVIIDIDNNNGITYANENAEHLFGLSYDGLLTKNLDDKNPFFQTDSTISKEVMQDHINDALKGLSPVFEWTTLNADQKKVVCEIRLVGLLQTGKNQVRASITDISERKNAELELNRLRNFLQNIVDSMPSILVGVDNNGHVTQWNKEAEKITGTTAKEAQGLKLIDVYPQFTKSIDHIRQAMTLREPWVDHKVMVQQNGETRYNDITIFPLIANGIEGAVVRIDDITDRIRIEEVIIQSEKMLSVGGLAAGMAHELNNPLAGIIQNLQVIQNRLSNELPKNISTAEQCGFNINQLDAYINHRGIKEMILAVMESGQRAAKIIDNMLSFSRKSSGYKESVDISKLLDKAVELAVTDYDLEKHYDFRQIEIIREFENQQSKAHCESNQIQQVFLNILINAAQSMNETEHIKKLTLRVFTEAEWICIEIEDNGRGMDEETRKRVFEPFFTTKTASIGTGLGLSVSYFIITENHEGHMTVESALGKGARFIIKLPLEKP